MVALRNGTELIRFHSATPGDDPRHASRSPACSRRRRWSASTCGRPTASSMASAAPAGSIGSTPITGAATPIGPVVPDGAVRHPASAWTSTRWSIACASSATPSRTSASTRTTAPSPASTRRSTRRARVAAAAYSQQRRRHRVDRALRHRCGLRPAGDPEPAERRRPDRGRLARRRHRRPTSPSTSRRSTTPPSRP